MTDLESLRGLEKRLAEATPPGPADTDELGVAVYETLGICSYIPDEGDPTRSLDARKMSAKPAWVKHTAAIHLRKNASGEVRIVKDGSSFPYENHDYMWTEGNYSCDCNRHLFFERAVGREPDEDVPCGDSLYTALKGVREDGTEFELDVPLTDSQPE